VHKQKKLTIGQLQSSEEVYARQKWKVEKIECMRKLLMNRIVDLIRSVIVATQP
jgi:hypothetical protein